MRPFTIKDLPQTPVSSIAFYRKEYYKNVMRIFRMIAASTFLAAITALSAFAQGGTTPARPATTPARPAASAPANANVPESKIAFINTEAFGDEKVGITRYVTAIKSLEKEFQPRQTELTTMNTRLKSLADEIQ